ncbi:HBR033Cp [Eremothecium sinecaudum]|uniref:HBR033Cp n=1 Tax=Eremothecium sinecaudum TaxID=45286 RepID=A0A120K117_9SACH|nr:HBR033Cp [Eremothecium sinecaudum]AMD18934.1 HBR033Cp [Eremothecium sinecaudum]
MCISINGNLQHSIRYTQVAMVNELQSGPLPCTKTKKHLSAIYSQREPSRAFPGFTLKDDKREPDCEQVLTSSDGRRGVYASFLAKNINDDNDNDNEHTSDNDTDIENNGPHTDSGRRVAPHTDPLLEAPLAKKPTLMIGPCEESSQVVTNFSLTQSLSSVMSQVRNFNNLPSSAIPNGIYGGFLNTPLASTGRRGDTSVSSTTCSTSSRTKSSGIASFLTCSTDNCNTQPLSEEYIGQWFGTHLSGEDETLKEVNCEEIGAETAFEHPLVITEDEDNAEYLPLTRETTDKSYRVPHIKYINLQDLDLQNSWTVDDIIQFYAPVYERPLLRSNAEGTVAGRRKGRSPLELTINEMKKVGTKLSSQAFKSRSNAMLDTVELEHWPSEKGSTSNSTTEASKMIETEENWLYVHLPNRRTRQQSLNPNFLRLYATELSSKLKNLLPDINVDEHALRKLSHDDIWNLDIPNKYDDVSPYQIKLALITRRKLWSEMCNILRQDLHGVNAPWNLKFVIEPQLTDDSDRTQRKNLTSSLVRLESDVKPWSKGGNQFMLRPCGKLSLGKNGNRDIQYVVKGWCDSRFC